MCAWMISTNILSQVWLVYHFEGEMSIEIGYDNLVEDWAYFTATRRTSRSFLVC